MSKVKNVKDCISIYLEAVWNRDKKYFKNNNVTIYICKYIFIFPFKVIHYINYNSIVNNGPCVIVSI